MPAYNLITDETFHTSVTNGLTEGLEFFSLSFSYQPHPPIG